MSDIENSLEDFAERFYVLSQEAKSYGISSAFGLVESDNLSELETCHFGYSGGKTTGLGIAVALVEYLKKEN